MHKFRPFAGLVIVSVLASVGCAVAVIEDEDTDASVPEGTVVAPRFEVDPFWPKPLPNHMVIGSTIGVSVDSRDHVWVIHRPDTLDAVTEIGAAADPPTSECCLPAPPVLEFDEEGTLVGSWGGPGEGYEWPTSNHGITVDYMDNVWIGGNGAEDSQILKFSRDGTFLLQMGSFGAHAGSNDRQNFWRVAEVNVDPVENEAYVADGYGNKRVAVLDADTGEMKRFWGAYGNVPDDRDLGPYDPAAPPAQQFRNPVHCAQISDDGFIYACDRVNDRIQVFTKQGEFVMEGFYAPETLGSGSAWDLAFSHDPEQTYLYLADGHNEKVYIILRETLELLTSFGDGGRQPGQFFGVHSIATDSNGNVYTTETYEGKRLQKFVYMGLEPITSDNQGPPWPGE